MKQNSPAKRGENKLTELLFNKAGLIKGKQNS